MGVPTASAKILLENRFAGRYKAVNIVEQTLLLDVILNGLQTQNLMNDLLFKGGGALQRIYNSGAPRGRMSHVVATTS